MAQRERGAATLAAVAAREQPRRMKARGSEEPMALEIERKFLVTGDEWRNAEGVVLRQGYLSTQPERTVRVRTEGDKAKLTIKGITRGATRAEYEYDIPPEDAAELLRLCEPPLIEKVRRRLEHDGLVWEVDEFLGDNQGLVVAEVELDREDRPLTKPSWVGEEVTHDPRYYNANLVANPFTKWHNSDKRP